MCALGFAKTQVLYYVIIYAAKQIWFKSLYALT